jgi:hypothetical protein
MSRKTLPLTIFLSISLLISCTENNTKKVIKNLDTNNSNLAVVANGEDFVRQGFLSKDGWNLNFNHVYVNLANIIAYESDPPFNAETDKEIKAKKQVTLLDTVKTIDLAEGDEQTSPILINKIKAEPGLYNALTWNITKGSQGVIQNQSIVIDGSAEKNGKKVNFVLNFNPELSYQCGEFIGDERKGILKENSQAEMEITMHFDHIFGDQKLPADDELNVGAIGFEPLAKLAKNDTLKVTMEELSQKLQPEEYQKLTQSINSLGHVGEGHCHEKSQ